MFNFLKTANDSDFLSLYLNLGISIGSVFGPFPPILRTGIAYEHRFGDKRRFGLYTKIGVSVVPFSLEGRVGFQALLGKRFSIALEPWLWWISPPDPLLIPGGKVALTWAFDPKRK